MPRPKRDASEIASRCEIRTTSDYQKACTEESKSSAGLTTGGMSSRVGSNPRAQQGGLLKFPVNAEGVQQMRKTEDEAARGGMVGRI